MATLKATTIGGNLTQHGAILIDSSTYSYNTTSMPTALSYGRLQCYGTLNLNADTDNSQTEYVILTSGHGCSSSTADGLAVGYNTLTWKDNTIIHAGNLSNYYQNKTSVGHTPYASGNTNTNLLTVNDLAYWDGSHTSSGSSNLAYCNQGSFGTIITKSKDDYVLKTGDTITGDINRDAGGSWISARDHCVIKTTRTSNEGHDWHPAVGVKTSSGFWSFGSVGGETLAFSYDTDYNYNHGSNQSKVIYLPSAGSEGELALKANHILKSGDRMSGHLTFDDSYAIEFKGAKDSAYTQFQYRDSIPTGTTHAKGGGVQSKGFYIFTNGYDDTNDYGGLAIDNEGVTVFGAGDNAANTGTFSWNPGASSTGGVFRVINEDNIAEGPQFIVTKSSGAFVRGSKVVTQSNFSYSSGTLTISF